MCQWRSSSPTGDVAACSRSHHMLLTPVLPSHTKFASSFDPGPWWFKWEAISSASTTASAQVYPHLPPPPPLFTLQSLCQVSKLDSSPRLHCPGHVIVPPPAAASPLWDVWTPSPFGRSSLFVEYSQFLRARLGLAARASAPQQQPVHIILVSRRSKPQMLFIVAFD